jgi:hypothetical protein
VSVNRFQDYILVLPEDDANRQLAVGFLLEPQVVMGRQIQILPPAGGWTKVRDKFLEEYLNDLERDSHGHLILLVDCDGKPERIGELKANVPANLEGRVFIVGCLHEPEQLKQGRRYDALGKQLARDCQSQKDDSLWLTLELRHNADELQRMGNIRRLLFGSTET